MIYIYISQITTFPQYSNLNQITYWVTIVNNRVSPIPDWGLRKDARRDFCRGCLRPAWTAEVVKCEFCSLVIAGNGGMEKENGNYYNGAMLGLL